MINLRFTFTPPAHHCSSKYLHIHLLPDASFPLRPVPAPLRAPPRRRLLRLPRAPPRRRRLRLPRALPTTSPSSCARALSAPALPPPPAVVSPSPIPPPLAGEARGGSCSDGSALTSFSGEPRSDMAVASTEQPPASVAPSSLPVYARAVAPPPPLLPAREAPLCSPPTGAQVSPSSSITAAGAAPAYPRLTCDLRSH